MTWTDFVVRGTLVLAAGFAASFAFARASAAVRHLIWTAAFVALLLLPVAMQLAPKVAVAVAAEPRAPAAARVVAQADARVDIAWSQAHTGMARRPSSWSDWLIAYLGGLLLVAARFLAGAVARSEWCAARGPQHTHKAAVDRVRGELGIGRTVRALESAGRGSADDLGHASSGGAAAAKRHATGRRRGCMPSCCTK